MLGANTTQSEVSKMLSEWADGTTSMVYWSQFPATNQRCRIRLRVLPHFLSISASETGCTQPHEDK